MEEEMLDENTQKCFSIYAIEVKNNIATNLFCNLPISRSTFMNIIQQNDVDFDLAAWLTDVVEAKKRKEQESREKNAHAMAKMQTKFKLEMTVGYARYNPIIID